VVIVRAMSEPSCEHCDEDHPRGIPQRLIDAGHPYAIDRGRGFEWTTKEAYARETARRIELNRPASPDE